MQEALRRAESEARAKAEKVAEVKRLTASIAAARAELNKYEEQLEDSRKYKEFLSALTPPEWFEEQKRLREEEMAAAKEQRRLAKVAELQADVDRRKEELIAQQPPLPKEQLEAALEAIVVELPDDWDANAPPPPDDEPMYFNNPKQLLDVFAALEEQNLFLIQSSQETEEQLEELLQTYRETKKRMDAETAGLHAQVAALEAAIAVREFSVAPSLHVCYPCPILWGLSLVCISREARLCAGLLTRAHQPPPPTPAGGRGQGVGAAREGERPQQAGAGRRRRVPRGAHRQGVRGVRPLRLRGGQLHQHAADARQHREQARGVPRGAWRKPRGVIALCVPLRSRLARAAAAVCSDAPNGAS